MQVMEAPVRVLRGLAAGAGKIIGVADRRKAKTAQAESAEAAAPETVEAPAAPETATADAATAETSGDVKLVEPETVEAAAPAAEAAPQAEAAPEAAPTAATPDTAAPATEEPAAELPLANYDELTVNSLRARMTKLSPDQLTVLIEYEKAHQGRDEVVGMLERRIIRINSGQTTSFQAVK
jgi:hypothetical protein